MHDLDRLHLFEPGDAPQLGAIADRGVGEDEHRRGVPHRDAERLDGHVEAVGRARRGQDRQRALPVATGVGLQEVGLLGLGRQAGGRATALHVQDHQRQLQHDRQADGLALQADARAARAGQRHRAAERRADGGAHGGDLVLGLDGPHIEVLQSGQLVQDVGRRRDRVAAVDERLAGQLRGGDAAEGERLVAADDAVVAFRSSSPGALRTAPRSLHRHNRPRAPGDWPRPLPGIFPNFFWIHLRLGSTGRSNSR